MHTILEVCKTENPDLNGGVMARILVVGSRGNVGSRLVPLLIGKKEKEEYAKFLAVIFVPVTLGYSSIVTDSVKVITGKDPGTLENYVIEHSLLWS